jgi:DNA-directed RNA polymerase subunit RPC12/RpoP
MQVTLLTVDLTKIRGKGDFRCPRCGIKISPDDSTEETYAILEPIMKEDSLEKILLQCNKCGSKIYLTGFYGLNQIK